jgi:hypothetical protein
MNHFLNNNDLGYYYSEDEMKKFLWMLDSILRGKDEGECIILGKVLRVKIEVEDVGDV